MDLLRNLAKEMSAMDRVLEVLVIVGLFLLRLGIPIIITLAVGYLLRRLDAKWEAEAQENSQSSTTPQMASTRKPCWEEKGCTEQQMAQCPACKWHDLPCWMARLRVENKLPTACIDCPRFTSKRTPHPIPT